MRAITYLSTAGGLGLMLLLGGCGGGGDGDVGDVGDVGDATVNNLAASSLEVVSADLRIGYPLKVSVSISADEGADDVSVSLFAIEKDQPPEQTRQFPLGTQFIPRVEAGENLYEVEVNVPMGVELAGSYFIAAVVNPVDIVPEADAEDNVASTVASLGTTPFPNVFMEEAVPDRSVLQLERTIYEDQLLPVTGEANNFHNADAGATLYLGAEGVEAPLDAEVFAKLRMTRSDRGTTHDLPLYLWNSDGGRYTKAFGVEPDVPCDPVFGCALGSAGPAEWLPIGQIQPQSIETVNDEVTVRDVDRASVHLDLYLPGKLTVELENALRHKFVLLSDPRFPPPDLSPEAIQDIRSFFFGLPGPVQDRAAVPEAMAFVDFAICVEIRPSDPGVLDRILDDNEICSPIAILLPPLPPPPLEPVFPPFPVFQNQTRPVLFSSAYKRDWGGKMFGYGIDFSASTTADERGLIAELHGALPVRAFGRAAGDIVAANVRGQVIPDYIGMPPGQRPGFTLDLLFAGDMLHRVDEPASGAITPRPVSFTKRLLPPDKCRAVTPPPFVPDRDCPPGQTNDPYTKIFTVGPVPVRVTASVTGNLGVEYRASFDNPVGFPPRAGIDLSAAPFANVEAKADAIAEFGVFSVRAEGKLTLVEEKFRFIAGADLELRDNNSSGAQIVISPNQTVVNVLSGAKGKLTAFARYTVPVFRSCSWGFITGVCPGKKTISVPFELASWKAPFVQRDPLFSNTDEIAVVVIPGQPVGYFRQ